MGVAEQPSSRSWVAVAPRALSPRITNQRQVIDADAAADQDQNKHKCFQRSVLVRLRATSLCCRTWGSAIGRLAGIPPTQSQRRTKLLTQSMFSIRRFGYAGFNRGGSAPAPQAPAAPAVHERQPLGLALWSYGHEGLRDSLTAEQRGAILRIKDVWHRRPDPDMVSGLDIYKPLCLSTEFGRRWSSIGGLPRRRAGLRGA